MVNAFTMTDLWDDVGFVISSQYRIDVLERLVQGPATPSQISYDTELAIAHVSRTLGRLREQSLVELLVPEDRKKGRVYGVTERGRQVWEQIVQQNMVDDQRGDRGPY